MTEDASRHQPSPSATADRPDWPIEWINTEIMEQLPAAVAVLDRRHRIVATNRAMRRLFGFDGEATVEGVDVLDLVQPEDRTSTSTYLDELTAGRLQRHVAENGYRGVGARRFRGRVVAAPVFDSSGRVRAVTCLFNDIAAETWQPNGPRPSPGVESEIDSPAQIDRGSMVSVMASAGHELRTSVHEIAALAETLTGSDLDRSDLELVDTIRSEAAKLRGVLDDLLDPSPIGSGSPSMMARPRPGVANRVERPVEPADRRRDDRPEGAGEAAGGTRRRPKVLVADDTEVNQLLARNQLIKLGYEPVVVDNGHEALARATSDPFDAILMDWHMPVMDGLEATRRIRASGGWGAEVPIIAVTANVLHGNRHACIEAGMNDFLTKPVSLDDLQAALTAWIPDVPDPAIVPDPAGLEVSAPHPEPVDGPAPPAGDDAGGTNGLTPDIGVSDDEAQRSVSEATSVVSAATLDELADELGDRSVVETVIQTFLDELDDRRESIAAIEALVELPPEDREDAGTRALRSAHTLKSTSALLGGGPLAARCQELETLLGESEFAAAADLVDETLVLIEQTRNELESHLATPG